MEPGPAVTEPRTWTQTVTRCTSHVTRAIVGDVTCGLVGHVIREIEGHVSE